MQCYLKSIWEKEEHKESNEEDCDQDGMDHGSTASLTNVKLNVDAAELISELLRLFTVEAFHRAQSEAIIEDSATIEPEHIGRIIAQIMLDFN